MATKLTVGIVPAENAAVTDLRRWFSAGSDIRNDVDVAEEALAFIADTGARSVVMTDRIIGCLHEEGIDYEGSTCPDCPSSQSPFQTPQGRTVIAQYEGCVGYVPRLQQLLRLFVGVGS